MISIFGTTSAEASEMGPTEELRDYNGGDSVSCDPNVRWDTMTENELRLEAKETDDEELDEYIRLNFGE
jgi:hypothetical protein